MIYIYDFYMAFSYGWCNFKDFLDFANFLDFSDFIDFLNFSDFLDFP